MNNKMIIGGLGLIVIVLAVFLLSGSSTKDKLIGSWSAIESAELLKFNDDGTYAGGIATPLPGLPDLAAFGYDEPGVLAEGTWTLSEDEKTLTSTFKFDKDLKDFFVESGGAAEMGMGSDGTMKSIGEITSIEDDKFCGTFYLETMPNDKEKECYKRITDEEYSKATKGYVDMNEFFREMISIAIEMGGF